MQSKQTLQTENLCAVRALCPAGRGQFFLEQDVAQKAVPDSEAQFDLSVSSVCSKQQVTEVVYHWWCCTEKQVIRGSLTVLKCLFALFCHSGSYLGNSVPKLAFDFNFNATMKSTHRLITSAIISSEPTFTSRTLLAR